MKLKLTGLLLTLLIPFGLSSPAFAGHHKKEEASDPIAAAAEFPLLLRRTTLIVRDIEASLKLYRDGLGMEVIYDEEINRPHSSEDREQRLRLIFLKASHDYVGVIGLIDYEYGYPDHPAHTKPVRREGFTPGNAILLFNTDELEDTRESGGGLEMAEIGFDTSKDRARLKRRATRRREHCTRSA